MPIPETPEFEEILGNLSLVRGQSDARNSTRELLSRPVLQDTGELVPPHSLYLTVEGKTTISIDGLLKRTVRELQLAGHAVTEELAVWFLAIGYACARIVGKRNSVAELNSLINSIDDGDVNLYYAFSPRVSHEYAFSVGNFYFGPLDLTKLRYQCERAKSDYFTRWEALLSQQSAVRRDPLRIRLLDIARIQERFGDPNKELIALWGMLLNGYFGVLATQLFESFLNELYDCQHVLVAFGAPRFDPRFFSRLVGANMVAVFLGIGAAKGGFVAPATIGQIRIDLVNAHKRIPQAVTFLRSEFGFKAFDGSPLHELIRLFVRFVSRARELHDNGNPDEALIQLIVALEIVFGERRNIADTTTERAAALIGADGKVDFRDVRNELSDLYEKRSRYVHQGHHLVNPDEIDSLLVLIRPILETLMRLQCDQQHRTKGYIQRWLDHLDFAAKSLLVQRRLEEKEQQIVLGFVVPSL